MVIETRKEENMKYKNKWLGILCISMILFLGGCGEKSIQLDLSKMGSELPEMRMNQFDISDVVLNVEFTGEPTFGDMEDIYEDAFSEKLSINKDYVERYLVRKSVTNEDIYMIFKPTEGNKDALKAQVDAYFKAQESASKDAVKTKYENRKTDEYEGYLIYIVSDHNEDVLNRIKGSKQYVFGDLTDVKEEMLTQNFDLSKDLLEEYQIKLPIMNVHANSYYILKPKKGNMDTVKTKMNAYFKKLEEQWSTYLPAQYELVQNRMEKEYGGYLIYIISNDNNAVFEKIKGYEK